MKLWINGEWCDGTEGVLDVENPATGETIAQVAKAGAADVDKAVAAAKAAFPEWKIGRASCRERVFITV